MLKFFATGARLDGDGVGRYGPPRFAALVAAVQRLADSGANVVLKAIFTWWNGATLGQRFHIGRRGVFVGQDDYGNRYFEARDNSDSYDQRKRRWVIYNGYAEASKVPAEWSGWLHYTLDEPPTRAPLKRREWEKDTLPNLTGTVHAWRPKGSLTRGGERPAATSDYQAWSPE